MFVGTVGCHQSSSSDESEVYENIISHVFLVWAFELCLFVSNSPLMSQVWSCKLMSFMCQGPKLTKYRTLSFVTMSGIFRCSYVGRSTSGTFNVHNIAEFDSTPACRWLLVICFYLWIRTGRSRRKGGGEKIWKGKREEKKLRIEMKVEVRLRTINKCDL